MEYLSQHIEGLIFTAEQPLSHEDIKFCLEETFEITFEEEELDSALQELIERYKGNEFAFEILKIGGGYQFLTKGAYHQSIGTLLKQTTKKRLSKAALETLSIIAYKQPVVKSELEKIRGVSCDYAIQKLLEKELVAIIGRSDAAGRPLLYGTSGRFMDYFGLSTIDDLPKPKDFKMPDDEVGEPAPIEEIVNQEEPNVPGGGIIRRDDANNTDEENLAIMIGDVLAIIYPDDNNGVAVKAMVEEQPEIISETEVPTINEIVEVKSNMEGAVVQPNEAKENEEEPTESEVIEEENKEEALLKEELENNQELETVIAEITDEAIAEAEITASMSIEANNEIDLPSEEE